MSDLIEVKLARDPLVAEEPLECVDLESTKITLDALCAKPGDPQTKEQRIYADKDRDGLNACEERLLGTDDSLFDSDADGLPDKVELVAGTNYLAVDPLQDPDFDGQLNRDEVRTHTDPRANDAQEQLDLAYRYEEVDEGIKPVLSFSQPPTITGVAVRTASSSSQPGVGLLRFDPADANLPGAPPSLSWQDAADGTNGFGPAVDVSVPRKDGYVLQSFRDDRYIRVMVDGKGHYLPKLTVDRIVISGAMRNCLRFRVRNITLLPTRQAYATTPQGPLKGTAGDNTVYIYFAQAPKEAKDGYGIFRVASALLNYQQGPPETRTPKQAELTFTDDDFVIFE